MRVYAAQAAFFIFLSAVPFLLLLLSLFGVLLPTGGETLRRSIDTAVPTDFLPLIHTLLRDVEQQANGRLLSLSALLLLWSASRGVRSIGAGIAHLSPGKRRRGFIGKGILSFGYTFLYIGAVILALGIWVFGDFLGRFAEGRAARVLLRFCDGVALLLLLSAIFALTYRGYGDPGIPFFACLPGGMAAAFGWMIYSSFFSIYVARFSRSTYLYGGLATVILLMMWLYACMEILLIGAGLNRFLLDRRS